MRSSIEQSSSEPGRMSISRLYNRGNNVSNSDIDMVYSLRVSIPIILDGVPELIRHDLECLDTPSILADTSQTRVADSSRQGYPKTLKMMPESIHVMKVSGICYGRAVTDGE